MKHKHQTQYQYQKQLIKVNNKQNKHQIYYYKDLESKTKDNKLKN